MNEQTKLLRGIAPRENGQSVERHRDQIIRSGSSRSHVEILIAEDSVTQAAHLKTLLEKNDFQVVATGNGAEALAALRQHKPTLVISDIVMPEMDGYELCRRIRADEHLTELPVILLTALSEPEDVFKGLECGADNFIPKPYEESQLLARIHYLLANMHLHHREKVQASMEVFLAGRKHVITSDRAQILNLLLSTYEAAIQQNRELAKAHDDLTRLNGRLEEKVSERTASLAAENAERRRAEDEVRKLNLELEQRVCARTAELEAANKELETFSYSVSHDLRAPLRAINTFSSDLLKEYASLLPPDGQKLLEYVISSAERLRRLIDDLLHFSLSGRKRLSIEPVSITNLVQSALREVRSENADRHIEIHVGDLPDCVGDSSLFNQVLINLLSNAFKFTRRKAVAVIEVGCRQSSGEKVYFVRDNGTGFNMQYAGRLFGVFERLHTNKDFEGNGVGLSIVQRIIQRHGGRVWAEAEADKGATFYFSLPK